CAQASVRMVLESFGKTASETELKQKSHNHAGGTGYDETNGTKSDDIPKMVHDYAPNAKVTVQQNTTKPVTIQDIKAGLSSGKPVILLRNVSGTDGGGHFIVIDKVEEYPDGTFSLSVRDPNPES